MIITKKHLPRRTFLRGLGVALGLPLLEGMIPALATAREAAAKSPVRLSLNYVPNGIMMDKWTPATEGANFELTPILKPLAPFRDRLLVLSGLAHNEALALDGEAGGDHARASASFLTGVHPKKTEGSDIHVGVSLDQIAAKELGRYTQLASLELSLDSTETLGICEQGYSCAYSNTLSWRTPSTPMPMENNPRAVFENLFGDSDSTDPRVRLAQVRGDHSILDFVSQDVSSLMGGLGSTDRVKLTEYLEAIRDVERRIELAEKQSTRNVPVLGRPASSIPSTFGEHARLMYDLQVLAYQCDLTRVITFMMGHEQTTRAYSEIGIPDAHHPLSHHGGNAEKIAKVGRINVFHTETFAYFLNKLKSTPDGDGTLLDHALILYGSGLSDGNMHRHDNLPIILVGGAGGQAKGGRHIRYPENTPMPDLYVNLLDLIGVSVEGMTNSVGKLEPLSIG
jgi:hypothetical protein